MALAQVLPASRTSRPIRRGSVGLEQVGGALQHRGARSGRRRRPARPLPSAAAASAALDVVGRRLAHLADHVAGRPGCAPARAAAAARASTPSSGVGRPRRARHAPAQGRGQRRQLRPRRRGRGRASCARARAVQRRAAAGSPDAAGRRAPSDAASALDRRTGSSHQLLERHRSVGDAVDERGVGAVLQQAAHQVGQQRLVRADRRVDAAGPAELAFGHGPHHLLVQRLAHAVQALELVLLRPVGRGPASCVDRRPACARCGSRTAGRPRRARPAACRAQAR